MRVHACVGGTSFCEGQHILLSGVHVIADTLGEAFNILHKQSFFPDYIKTFALDEANEMPSRSVKDQIYTIFQSLSSQIQDGMFSTTTPPESLETTKKFKKINPCYLQIQTNHCILLHKTCM